MVPLRFIAETIGLEVEWDNNTKTAYLYSALANRNLEELPDDFIYIYSEEYQIVGDPSDGLNASDAAKVLVRDKLSSVYEFNTDEPVYITLLGLQCIETSH